MSDIEREEFEQAFLNQYTDFERFENGEYMDDFLQQSWIGWQASREALEGEPVAVVDRVGIMQRLSPYTNLPEGTKLYTHPVSDVPDAEYIRVLQDAFDIIQADANTEQNYWFLCRIGRVLAKLKAKQEQGQ